MKKKLVFQARQGDVMLEMVDAIPAKAVKKPTDQGRIVLAYGEVTGHAHVVQTDAEAVEAFLAELNGETYLSAEGGARVVHDEHSPITLPPGRYKVTRQREYFPDAIRTVGD